MSKKHFQAVAAVMYKELVERPHAGWWITVQALADVFAIENPRFDRARFIEACETGRCKGMKGVAA